MVTTEFALDSLSLPVSIIEVPFYGVTQRFQLARAIIHWEA
jgi:hypothetical protein